MFSMLMFCNSCGFNSAYDSARSLMLILALSLSILDPLEQQIFTVLRQFNHPHGQTLNVKVIPPKEGVQCLLFFFFLVRVALVYTTVTFPFKAFLT